MISAAAIANEFLDLGASEPSVPPVDQMKLQKLLFYAHAWHLAMKEVPLFEEDFEAWPWGPVVRDIYHQTAECGRAPVTSRLVRVQRKENGEFGFEIPRVTDPEVKEFVRSVWESHKAFTGVQLSNATHAPGEPWTIVRDAYASLASKPTIPNDIIKSVFRKKLENAENAVQATT